MKNITNKIAKNYIYNTAYQLLIILIPMITAPYLSRVLGANSIGAYGYTNSISQYFVLFGCVGLNLYGQREIAYCQNNIESRTKVFWELQIIRLIFTSVATIVFVCTVCQNKEYGLLFQLHIIELVASMLDVGWFFLGLEDFKAVVLRNGLIKILGTALIFLLVKTSDDLVLYILINVSTLLLGNLFVLVFIPKYLVAIKIKKINILNHIGPALFLFIPQIATNIYTLLDRTMLGYITKTDAEVGYYDQAQKIIRLVLTIPTSLSTVMLPRISSLYTDQKIKEIDIHIKTALQFTFMLTLPLCMGICAVANDFIPWFLGPGYEKSIDNLIFLSPLLIIIGISNVLGNQYLVPTGKQKVYTNSIISGLLVNIALNIILIPKLLSIGAALASLCAELIISIIQLFIVRDKFNILELNKAIVKYIFASIVMFFVVKGFSFIKIESLTVKCFTEILIGIVIYGILLNVLNDSLFNNIKKNILKK